MTMALFLADFFGISNGTFLHWMLAISLTLLVLDVFCNTEVLSWISMLVFSLWATMQFELPVQWLVLVYVLVLIVCAVFYYSLWTHCVRRLVMDGIMRHAPREAQDNLAGTAGRIVGEGDTLSLGKHTLTFVTDNFLDDPVINTCFCQKADASVSCAVRCEFIQSEAFHQWCPV